MPTTTGRRPDAPAALPDLGAVLAADRVRVGDGPRALLPPTSLRLQPGTVTVAVAPPGRAHAALALVLAGRLAPTAGSVSFGGDTRRDALQRAVALVDVPAVSEPDGAQLLVDVVAEELALAGRRSDRRQATAWLRRRDLVALRRTAVEAVPAAVRTAVLAELAASRPGVRYVVAVLPERHGVAPAVWAARARELADAGLGVLLTATPTAAAALELPAVPFGSETC